MSINVSPVPYDLLGCDAQKTALHTLLASSYYRGVVEDNLSDDIYDYFENPDATSYPVYVLVSLAPVSDRPLLPSHQVRIYVEACDATDVLDFFVRVLGEESPLNYPNDVSIVGYYRTDGIAGDSATLDIEAHDDDVELIETFVPAMNMWWNELYTDIENLATNKKENEYYTEDGAYHRIQNHPELLFSPNGKFISPEQDNMEEGNDLVAS